MRRRRPFYIFALGITAAIPTAWFLAGSGLGAMIVMIVFTFVFSAIFEMIWRRITKQD